jgi:O-antigen biosynthesis protein
MSVKLKGITRGSEKIFARVIFSDLELGTEVSLRAFIDGGREIPSLITPFEDSFVDYICCLPDVKTSEFHLSFNAVKDGMASSLGEVSFTSAESKWESRLRYRLKPGNSAKMRDYDRMLRKTTCAICFTYCFEDVDDNIFRANIELPYRENNDLKVSVFNMKLEPVDVGSINMGDSVYKREATYNDFAHSYTLSFRLPKTPEHYLFVLEDLNNPDLNSFDVLNASTYEEVRLNTYNTMKHAQFDECYPTWFEIRRVKGPILKEQSEIEFPYEPVFSIVVPLFKTPLNLFSDVVESVRNQSYEHWQLVLVNASPEDSALTSAAYKASESDNRIALVTVEKNLGISLNTNAGIEAATGDFVSFFDHDDVLEPDILFEYAKYINENMACDVLYCDEDKLMPDGTFSQPFFKPDFNIDLLRHYNYVCHMLTIRRSLLDKLAPNTAEFDGAQDHNLTFEAVEKARHVGHVPRILYHWRITANSTAGDASAKDYAAQAGIKAVQAHLNRLGLKGTVSLSRRTTSYKVLYDVPEDHPLVSIIIPSMDHVDLLGRCVESIAEKSTYDNYEIVVIENNSVEESTFEFYKELQRKYPDVVRVVTWKHEFNFSKLMNFGRANSYGSYLLLLNNDTEVITPNWIEIMLGICAREDVGCVGVKLYYPDDTIQHAGVALIEGCAAHLNKNLPRRRHGYFDLDDSQQDLSAVTAACVMVSVADFDAVDGFTEVLSVAFNDIDFCLKLREKNLLVVYTPEVELYHYESMSRGLENNEEKQIRFLREVSYMRYRWASYYIKGDPYFSRSFEQGGPRCAYYHLC